LDSTLILVLIIQYDVIENLVTTLTNVIHYSAVDSRTIQHEYDEYMSSLTFLPADISAILVHLLVINYH